MDVPTSVWNTGETGDIYTIGRLEVLHTKYTLTMVPEKVIQLWMARLSECSGTLIGWQTTFGRQPEITKIIARRVIRPKPDDRINKNQMTKYF